VNLRGYFNYLHLRFDLEKGWNLVANYAPTIIIPQSEWLPVKILMTSQFDTRNKILVATLAFDNRKTQLVIDGLSAANLAIRKQVPVEVFILTFSDTLKVLTTPMSVRRNIINQGKAIGL